jgi:hypothetical protein
MQKDFPGGTMSKHSLLITILTGTCVALHVAGCSVTLFTVGVVADATKSDYDTLQVWKVDRLAKGDSVFVTGDTDTMVSGVYLGKDETATKEYTAAYALWQAHDTAAVLFPSLGDRVTLVRHSPLRGDVEGILLGFDRGAICVQAGADTEMVAVGDIWKVASNGKVTPGDTLKTWLASGRVPFLSTILVQDGAGTQRIPLYEVHEIRKANVKNLKWKGLAAGIAGDLVLVGLWALAYSNLDLGMH